MIQALTPIVKPPYDGLAVMMTLLVLPYVCVSLLLQTKDDFRFVIPYVEFARDLKGGRPLIVDSSSLIDGRIADVVETQILESQLIVPDFVLAEVQDVADSTTKIVASEVVAGLRCWPRCRRVHTLMSAFTKPIERNFVQWPWDHKLVELAKQLRGGVINQ